MTVLVTGVAGRVGSLFAGELIRAGYDVRGMVRPGGRTPDDDLAGKVELVEASLGDAVAIERAVRGVDTVVHLAAQIVIGDSPVDQYYDTNVLGTLRLLEAAAGQASPVRRFVYASTDNTYGPARPRTRQITEEDPQVPGDYYGTSKLLGETLVRNYHRLYGLPYTILRYGSVVAPHETVGLFRLEWVRAFLAGHVAAGKRSNLCGFLSPGDDPVGVLDAATGARDDNPAVVLTGPDREPWAVHLTDVRDVVAGTLLAMEHPDAAGEAFNIGGPGTTTFAAAAEVLNRHFRTDTVVARLPVKLAFELSTDKARRVLGYAPKWDLDGMLTTALSASPAGSVPSSG
ncbi:hypothetical protein DI005_24000 [Prauserella sp. PE36]|uniref:NAD(P)-dependent oxidoreductase n=1 Tax=Prauserella endophytica TaxID=1592324 RepID=A0ABY2RZD8_9PSEU|nr:MULTISPECIES: NAD(P)-dependent oxidoreductase [Prauserella]RBM16961.1 hypothetical protein DI005_24000 [Prauserella sp. PE36]TKG66649.1 NAD(P)-dependent oxidoreductase [Prauserella endophytica]